MYRQPYRELGQFPGSRSWGGSLRTRRIRPARRSSPARPTPMVPRAVATVRIPERLVPILRQTGGTYLGEDETYYYWMEPGPSGQLGGFFDGIGNMFKRMVKFTPKSFTPGNIYKGFINTTLTTATFGAYQFLPKSLKKSVYNIGKIAVPVIAGGVLAVTAGPAVMAMLMPKLTAAGGILSKGAGAVGGIFGGKSSGGGQDYGPPAPGQPGPGVFGVGGGVDRALTIGSEVMNLLNKLPQNKQAEVVQQLTPEDIAYMETNKQIPPHLRDYFDRMAQQTFNPPMPPQAPSGAASLYPEFPGPTDEAKPVQAGFFGELNMGTILLFAVPLGFYFLTAKGKR